MLGIVPQARNAKMNMTMTLPWRSWQCSEEEELQFIVRRTLPCAVEKLRLGIVFPVVTFEVKVGECG